MCRLDFVGVAEKWVVGVKEGSGGVQLTLWVNVVKVFEGLRQHSDGNVAANS